MAKADPSDPYPEEAYSEDGVLWWKLETAPGTNRPLGAERKIASWLFFNLELGDTFTMRDVREALGDRLRPDAAEHLNRRLRRLRDDGWQIASGREEGLPADVYCLRGKGWHPGLGKRSSRSGVSASLRRAVLDRDGRRCVVCGVGAGEPYAGQPNSVAKMTVGHRVPHRRDSSARSADELQAECQRCNEPLRDQVRDPVRKDELSAQLKGLRRADREQILLWIEVGHRVRTSLEALYDQIRTLSGTDQRDIAATLRRSLPGAALR